MALRHVSPTSWKLWLKCRRAFYFRYIAELPTKQSFYGVRGEAWHLGAELFYQHPAHKRSLTLLGMLADVMAEEYEDAYEAAGGDVASFPKWLADCNLGLLGIEHPVRVDVQGTEEKHRTVLNGVPVYVIVDRVEGAKDSKGRAVLGVSDYKTGKRRPLDHRIQMVLSAAVVNQATGEPVPKGRLLWVSTGQEDEVLTGPAARETVLDQLAEVWHDQRAAALDGEAAFPAKPQRLCEWCDFLDSCPQGRKWMRDFKARRR